MVSATTGDYLLSYREKVIELVSRWIGRRSQRSMSKTDFYQQYLPRHPLARTQAFNQLVCITEGTIDARNKGQVLVGSRVR